jgi:hypothetical protein
MRHVTTSVSPVTALQKQVVTQSGDTVSITIPIHYSPCHHCHHRKQKQDIQRARTLPPGFSVVHLKNGGDTGYSDDTGVKPERLYRLDCPHSRRTEESGVVTGDRPSLQRVTGAGERPGPLASNSPLRHSPLHHLPLTIADAPVYPWACVGDPAIVLRKLNGRAREYHGAKRGRGLTQ